MSTDPRALIGLLMQQLGRVPSLDELYCAMGIQTQGETPGQEAGAEDSELSLMLNQKEAMGRQLVKMLLFGTEVPHSNPFVIHSAPNQPAVGGRDHGFLPFP